MFNLYGSKRGSAEKLVATFDSEQQLLAYVRWATLSENDDGTFKFEQGSPLVGSDRWSYRRADEATEAEADFRITRRRACCDPDQAVFAVPDSERQRVESGRRVR